MRMNQVRFGLCAALLLGVCVGCGVESEDGPGALDESEQVGSVEQSLRADMVQIAYQASFGRVPTQAELVYWTNSGTEPSATEMHQYLGNWLASPNGATDRRETINRAYLTVYNRHPGPVEMQYWNRYVDDTETSYSELVYWLEDYGRRYWYPVTGSFYVAHYFGGSIAGTYWYTSKSGSTYSVPAQ